MRPLHQPRHTSYYRTGDAIRSRCVGDVVLSGTVDVTAPPSRLVAEWDRETRLSLEPGDVEQLPLARARRRWPDYGRCVQAASDWIQVLGFPAMLASCDVALMACRGARYHHDGDQYGGAVFCNLFLSDDKGLDLHFPSLGHRIPLTRGVAVVFDTGQPHAVIPRNSGSFRATDFPLERDCTLAFLTWELPVEHTDVAHLLNIAFDTEAANALLLDAEQVWWEGARKLVCPETGEWRTTPVRWPGTQEFNP